MGKGKAADEDFDPSLPLDNPKWEAFVLAFMKHRVMSRAYKEVYPNATDDSAATLGPQLFGNVHIRARLQVLEQQALFASGYRPEAIVAELVKFGLKGSLRHFLSKNAQGEPVFDFSAAMDDPEKMDTLGEITIDSYYDAGLEKQVKSVRLKLESRQDALKTLATMQGMFEKDNAQKSGATIIVQTGIEDSPNVPTDTPLPDEHESGH